MHTTQHKNIIPNLSRLPITRGKHFSQSWLLTILLLAFFGQMARAQVIPVEISLAYSLAQYQTSIKNQDGRSSCWAFAGVAAMEAAYKRKYGLELDLSEQYAFHMLKVMDLRPAVPENNISLDGFQGDAGIVSEFVKYAIPEDRFAPYLNGAQMTQLQNKLNLSNLLMNRTQTGYDTFEFDEGHIPTAARWNAKYRVTDFGQISSPTNSTALEQALNEKHEIVADFKLFWKLNAANNVWEYDSTAGGAGHVMLIIGYNQKDQVFILKNSYGEKDFIRVTYDFIKRTIGGAYYIKDVADPNEAPQKKARFLGIRKFDAVSSGNTRLKGRLVIRRFLDLHGDPNAGTKLGTLYPDDGTAPLNVNGYFTNNGDGVVLDIKDASGTDQHFVFPFGFWAFVDSQYAGAVETGTDWQPFKSFGAGVNAVPRYGTVFLSPGSHRAVGVYDKPLTIRTLFGPATLGN